MVEKGVDKQFYHQWKELYAQFSISYNQLIPGEESLELVIDESLNISHKVLVYIDIDLAHFLVSNIHLGLEL